MIKGDYEYLNNLAKNNVCAEHHTPLTVAWHSQEKTWFLRCAVCEYPKSIIRQLSLTQEYKAGSDIPEPIKSNIEKGVKRRTMQSQGQSGTTSLSLMPTTDLATGEILDQAWHLKRGLASKITNSQIDTWYAAGRDAGAYGGKLCGAGAGGFLMFLAPPDRHDALRAALPIPLPPGE